MFQNSSNVPIPVMFQNSSNVPIPVETGSENATLNENEKNVEQNLSRAFQATSQFIKPDLKGEH